MHSATFAPATVTRYITTTAFSAAGLRHLWYGVFSSQAVQVVLVRDNSKTAYNLALVSTDLAASATQIIERYASLGSIAVCTEDAKQTSGVGQGRSRLRLAVGRTIPFALIMTQLRASILSSTSYAPGSCEAIAWKRARALGTSPVRSSRSASTYHCRK